MNHFIKKMFCINSSSVSLLQLISLLIIFSITKTLFDAVLILSLSVMFSIVVYFAEKLLSKININQLKFPIILIILGSFVIFVSVSLQRLTSYNVVCASTGMFWFIYSRINPSDKLRDNLLSIGKTIIVPSALLLPFAFVKELLSGGKILQSFTKEGIVIIKGASVTYANSISFVLIISAITVLIAKSICKNKTEHFFSGIKFKGTIKAISIIILSSMVIGITSAWLLQLAGDTFIISHIVLLTPYLLTGAWVLAFNYLAEDINILPSYFSIILIASICLSQIIDIKSMLTTLILFCIPLYIILVYGEFCQNKSSNDPIDKLVHLLAYASIITLAL